MNNMICALNECNDYSVLQEIKTINTNASTYKIRGNSLLQTLDEVNGNRRVYSHAIGEICVKSANDKIARGKLLGEMDHPFIKNPKDPYEVKRQFMVMYKDVSHKFNKMWIEGNNICGLVETLSNRNGVDLAKLANIDEVPIGFSCRAVGNVKPSKTYDGKSIMEVTEPIVFVTYDAVTDPSHKSAELQDITSVITSAGDLQKMKHINENEEIIIDESNCLYDLYEIFYKNKRANRKPLSEFVDNFMCGDINYVKENNQIFNEEQESIYAHKKMNNLLNEYMASSNKISGISEYDELNETNFHDLMNDYSNDWKNNYSTIKSTRAMINKYMGY